VVKALTAREVMNPDVMAVRADMTVRDLAAFLAERQITGAPVIDADGRLVGVVSLMDIAESRAEGVDVAPAAPAGGGGIEGLVDLPHGLALRIGNAEASVSQIMTPAVYTIVAETPVADIARTMISGRIHRLFVTENERIVGIVTSLDLVKLLCSEG